MATPLPHMCIHLTPRRLGRGDCSEDTLKQSAGESIKKDQG